MGNDLLFNFLDEVGSRIDPDQFFVRNTLTFIFANNKIYAAPFPTMHSDLLKSNSKEILDQDELDRFDLGSDYYWGATQKALLGRVSGPGQLANLLKYDWGKWCDRKGITDEFPFWGRTVTFWNDADDSYRVLDECLKALLSKGYVDAKDLVLTPTGIVRYVAGRQVDTKATNRVGTATLHDTKQKDVAARIALAKKLHLMKAGEKKAAMAQLGLVQGSVKNPWHSEMERQGLVKAGQKWWAPQSENLSFGQWLASEEMTPDERRRTKLADKIQLDPANYKPVIYSMKKQMKK